MSVLPAVLGKFLSHPSSSFVRPWHTLADTDLDYQPVRNAATLNIYSNPKAADSTAMLDEVRAVGKLVGDDWSRDVFHLTSLSVAQWMIVFLAWANIVDNQAGSYLPKGVGR